MRHKKKQLTLPQKVFIVKTFYQCNDVEAVRKAIAKNFQVHSNSSIHPVIDKLVASFETSGSVNQSYSYEVSEEDVGKEDLKVQPGNQAEDVPEELPENEIVYDVFLVEEEAEPNANGSDLPYDTIIEEVELLLPSSEEPDPSVEATKNNLQDKTNRSKDRRSKKHTCRYCQKEFCGRYLVPHYRKMHSDKAVYICSVCDEPFMAWEDYKEHKAQHIKQRCLKCPECDKVYPTMGTYNRHLKHHSGQRNHVCEWCGKGFLEAAALKLHIRIHTNEKPFECSTPGCGKSFSTKSSLTVHGRVHSGERPYKCNFCDKRFADASTRNVHHRQHTGENPFVCSLCGKSCKQGQNLKSHMRHVHKM